MKRKNSKQYDLVLGGDCLSPTNGAILGGMEGIKRRVAAPNDYLNEPQRLIEYDANAQSLLGELMRYFYSHCDCITYRSRKLMRLKYQRHHINLKTVASAVYPENIDIYAPTYCGYLSHMGLLIRGDRAMYYVEGKPRQWLDKALLHNALLIDKNSLVHVEIKHKPVKELSHLYLVEMESFNGTKRNYTVTGNNIFQACLCASLQLPNTINMSWRYNTYIISCKLWKDGNWVMQEANFPVLALKVIKHEWDCHKQDVDVSF